MKNKLPILMIALGMSVAFLSSIADFIGLGSPGGVPALQIIAGEIGAVIALIGIWLLIHQGEGTTIPKDFWRRALDRILAQPVLVWMVLGFAISYLLFFIFPTFLNSANKFRYPGAFFIEREHIGFDTRLILEHIRVWYTGERDAKYLFPPLTAILAAPLLLLRYPQNYYVVTAVTLAGYFIVNLILPLFIVKGKSRSLLLFIFGISAFSYGMQFELETGQFYMISMAFCLAAIYIFHNHPSYRIFAYLFFCISVQLKLFPILFIVMFIECWDDWAVNLKRLSALAAANFFLLFLLGLRYFEAFINRLKSDAITDQLDYNHSIFAFTGKLAISGYGLFSGSALDWINAHIKLIEVFLYGYFFLCLIITLVIAYRQKKRGINGALFMVCTLGSLMLMPLSHDYKLPLLEAPFILAMYDLRMREGTWARIVSIGLVVAASFAYSATLVPFNARPAYLENAFPLLFALLTAVTILKAMQPNDGFKYQSEAFQNLNQDGPQ